jgi:hypothetical protein
MITRIENNFLRRLAIVVAAPPLYLFVALCGAIKGFIEEAQEMNGDLRAAWRGLGN